MDVAPFGLEVNLQSYRCALNAAASRHVRCPDCQCVDTPTVVVTRYLILKNADGDPEQTFATQDAKHAWTNKEYSRVGKCYEAPAEALFGGELGSWIF